MRTILNRTFACLVMLLLLVLQTEAPAATCTPTPWDEIGPFYRPNAPVRNSIGTGYVLSGTVRSAEDCHAISNARIEIWQAGPDGSYSDNYRATLFSDSSGRYRLQTFMPPPYGRRPSHIHILVDAKGYEGLIAQHYPRKGDRKANFDLVLVSETKGKAKSPLGR